MAETFRIGRDATIGGQVKKIGWKGNAGKLEVGRNSSINGRIQNVNGSINVGKNSILKSRVQNINGDLILGENTNVKSQIQIKGDIIAKSGTIFRSQVADGIICPDGSSTVTFNHNGSCRDE